MKVREGKEKIQKMYANEVITGKLGFNTPGDPLRNHVQCVSNLPHKEMGMLSYLPNILNWLGVTLCVLNS